MNKTFDILKKFPVGIIIEKIAPHNKTEILTNKPCWWRIGYCPNPKFMNVASMTFERYNLEEVINEMHTWLKENHKM